MKSEFLERIKEQGYRNHGTSSKDSAWSALLQFLKPDSDNLLTR